MHHYADRMPTENYTDNVSDIPLIFDLDGTIILSDTTYELCLMYIKAYNLFGLLQLIFWRISGKVKLKENLGNALGHQFNCKTLPYNTIDLESNVFAQANTRGLVSGSPDIIVKRIAAHLGGFDFNQGTQTVNLIGTEKAAFLEDRYPDGFDYVGDSKADIPVWKLARKAYGANISKSALTAAKSAGIKIEIISIRPSRIPAIFKAMRLQHWVKNLLIFTVPMMNLAEFNILWLVNLSLAFVFFGMVASATYMLNDLLDIPFDRMHHRKQTRPFASGALDVKFGIGFMIALFMIGLLSSYFIINEKFFLMVLGYSIISAVYSSYIKKIIVLDVLVLSLLFCWRVLTGADVINIATNPWFIISIAFFFFSLAMGKRSIELNKKAKDNELDEMKTNVAIAGRGYQVIDQPVIMGIGIGAGISSAIITLIYTLLSDSDVIESDVIAIIIVSSLVSWISRFWLLVNRDQVHDDPVVFAIKDRTSMITLGVIALMVVIEQLVLVG